jgi:hypothetical protein
MLDRGVVGQNEYVSNQSPSPTKGGTAISLWVESLIGQATGRGRPGHATTMPHPKSLALDYRGCAGKFRLRLRVSQKKGGWIETFRSTVTEPQQEQTLMDRFPRIEVQMNHVAHISGV